MKKRLLAIFLLISVLLPGCMPSSFGRTDSVSLAEIPPFSDEPYVVLEDNQPDFPEEDFTSESFEEYSPLDALGRCGTAYANVGVEPCRPRSAAPSAVSSQPDGTAYNMTL